MAQNSSGKGRTLHFTRLVDDDVLDDGTADSLTEESLVVVAGVGGQVQDSVALAVEVALVVFSVLADGSVGLPVHVDVGSEDIVGDACATVHESSEVNEILRCSNLIDA